MDKNELLAIVSCIMALTGAVLACFTMDWGLYWQWIVSVGIVPWALIIGSWPVALFAIFRK